MSAEASSGFERRSGPRAPAARRATGRPVGGWIAAGLPHRTWVDPFVVVDVLPVEPRLIFFGDGPAIFRSAGGAGSSGGSAASSRSGRAATARRRAHLAGAGRPSDEGAVLCLFPESGPATPPGTARPFGPRRRLLRAAHRSADRARSSSAARTTCIAVGASGWTSWRRSRGRISPTCRRGTARRSRGPPPSEQAAHRIAAALHDRTADAVAGAPRRRAASGARASAGAG